MRAFFEVYKAMGVPQFHSIPNKAKDLAKF